MPAYSFCAESWVRKGPFREGGKRGGRWQKHTEKWAIRECQSKRERGKTGGRNNHKRQLEGGGQTNNEKGEKWGVGRGFIADDRDSFMSLWSRLKSSGHSYTILPFYLPLHPPLSYFTRLNPVQSPKGHNETVQGAELQNQTASFLFLQVRSGEVHWCCSVTRW